MKKVLVVITVITLLFSMVTCFAETTNAEIKVKLNKRKLFYFLSAVYILAIVIVGVLWSLGIY